MHLRIFTSVIFSFFFCCAYSQWQQPARPAIVWQKWYGGSGIDRANDVLLTADGGMIVAGTSISNDGDVTGNHGNYDGWIIKLNASGQMQWQRSIGGSGNDGFNTIIKCDGGYLAVGYTSSNDGDVTNLHNPPGNDYKRDYLVVKLSDSGTIIWSKAFGGSSDDFARTCIQTSGGDYIIIGDAFSGDGDVQSDPNNFSTAWMLKVNPSGNIVWESSLLSSTATSLPHDGGFDVIETDDHELLAYSSASRTFDTSFYEPIWVENDTTYYDTITYNNIYDKYGLLYKVSINTGQAELLFTTAGDYDFAMKKMPDGIYLSYFDVKNALRYEWDLRSGICAHEQSVLARLDESTGNISLTPTYFESCDAAGSTLHARFFPSSHGSEKVENGLWMQTGTVYFMSSCGGDDTQGFLIIPGQGNYAYGGTANDMFTSVKALSNGYEFICVGSTGSVDGDLIGHGPIQNECMGVSEDFWIVKLSTNPNYITGTVFLDENNNNIKDTGETAFTKGMIQITKPGYDVSYSITNGHYKAEVDTGSFVTQLVFTNPVYYSAVPVSDTAVFTTPFAADTINFAVHKNGDFHDNAVAIFSGGTPVRPGRPVNYTIRIAANGTVGIVNKTLTLIKDAQLQFSAASVTPVNISGDTIVWNIDSVPVNGEKLLSVSLLADIPPALNGGDTVYNVVLLDTTADLNANDNQASLKQRVVNSYDPNDKSEVHAGAITKLEVKQGNYLTYTIRFQNTGNDTAFNITIRDGLDEKLIGGSFEMISASHPYELKMVDGKYLSWTFKDILLVDSNHNEPASHGYITYRIKPKNNVVIGEVISNKASIYFDFNPAVVTNTEKTAVIKTTAVWTGEADNLWSNPANWNIKVVPDGETLAIIPADVPHYPVVNGNAVCYGLQVDKNATIQISEGYNLEITGR